MKAIIFDWIGTLYDRHNGLYPHSERVLRLLRPRYRLGLVSLAKGGVDMRRAQIESSGIFPLFDSVVIATQKGPPEYLRCMQELETIPANTAIVDDRVVRGIKVGNELGCPTFWIRTGEYAHERPTTAAEEPSMRIDSVEDLLRFL